MKKLTEFFKTTKGFVTGVVLGVVVVGGGVVGIAAATGNNTNTAQEETTTVQESTTIIEETTTVIEETDTIVEEATTQKTTTLQNIIAQPQYVISGNILMSISNTASGKFTIPEGVTYINEGILSGVPITDFIVPAYVTKLGNNLCGMSCSCPTLKAIVFYNTTPIEMGGLALNHDQLNGGCLIYVPDESIQAYTDYFHSKHFFEYELLLRPLSTY